MLNLETITIFHRGWDKEQGLDTYVKNKYQAHWYEHTIATSQADGLKYSRECKVRIPGIFTIDISTGDRILRGKSDSISPDKKSLEVVGFSDNRKGINPHWLVMAK